jgi:protein TonB
MDFAQQQRDPTRHLIGIAFVILVHGLVIWALLTGMGSRIIEVIKKPIEATIVKPVELPPPPPPPPRKIIEAPKIKAVEQPYVPPPDVPVPVQSNAPTITSTPTPPPKEYVIEAPPVVVAPPPPPPKPAIRRGIQRIGGDNPDYPKEAARAGINSGRVVARLHIDENGNVTQVEIVSSEPPRVFDKAVRNTLSDWKFRPEGEKYIGEVEINFVLK